jgi:DNA-binding phage protein
MRTSRASCQSLCAIYPKGIAKVAKAAGIERDSLYRTATLVYIR